MSAHPPPSRIQIFGERCSGTNWISELLRRNLRGIRVVDDFGWKHGWVYGDLATATDCAFVIVHRDPFDWLRSLHKKPWHAAAELRDVPFERFVRTPWRCIWGADMELAADDPRHGTEMTHERDPETDAPFANPMRLRTAKTRAWNSLRGRVPHYVDVRYETVREDSREFVRQIAERLGLRRRLWFHRVDTFKGGKRRFRQKSYDAIAPADLEWIAAELDGELERAHGYDIGARVRELSD